jgi:hypothetical protein
MITNPLFRRLFEDAEEEEKRLGPNSGLVWLCRHFDFQRRLGASQGKFDQAANFCLGSYSDFCFPESLFR